MNSKLIEQIWDAAVATVEAAGPIPEEIADMPAHTRHWIDLIRGHDARLQQLSNAEIEFALKS
jgi:hypothetical protein